MALQNVVSPTFAIDSGWVNPPSNAFDGGAESNWATSRVSSEGISGICWIGQNFGTARNITQITIKQFTTGTAISDLTIQYSDNGSSWTSQGAHSISKDTALNTMTFTSVGSHQYWRLLAGANPGGNERWQVTEITMLQESGGAQPSTKPLFTAYNSTNQSLASGVLTKVAMDTTYYDNAQSWNPTLSRWTPPVAGYYHIDLSAHFLGSLTDAVDVQIFRNDQAYLLCQFDVRKGNAGYGVDLYLNGTTDYIELWVRAFGSNLSLDGPKGWINAHRIQD